MGCSHKWKRFVRFIGRGLNNFAFIVMVLWAFPWICTMACCSDAGMVIFGSGMFINSVVFVVLLHVFEVYSTIQSLEVSFLVFWFCVAAFSVNEAVQTQKKSRQQYEEFERALFKFFQIEKNKIKGKDMDGVVFHYVFISLIPAIIAGYIANWFLQNRYELDCNPNISEEESAVLCGESHPNQTCCVVVFISSDIYAFFGIAFANIFAGYKIVSALVRFLFTYYWYDGTKADDDGAIDKDKVKELVDMALDERAKSASPAPHGQAGAGTTQTMGIIR
eukprot:162806_1